VRVSRNNPQKSQHQQNQNNPERMLPAHDFFPTTRNQSMNGGASREVNYAPGHFVAEKRSVISM
jgi:hypothetical protein